MSDRRREAWDRLLPGERREVCNEIARRIATLRRDVRIATAPTMGSDIKAWEAALAALGD